MWSCRVIWGKSSLLGFFAHREMRRTGEEGDLGKVSGEIMGREHSDLSPHLDWLSCPEPTAHLFLLPMMQLCLAVSLSAQSLKVL